MKKAMALKLSASEVSQALSATHALSEPLSTILDQECVNPARINL